MEGHIVRVVSLYDGDPLPFVCIWDWLQKDLKGKIDEKTAHKMYCQDFDVVTKRKIGFRLREVLSGERKRIRTSEGQVRAWVFDTEKLRRVAKKYGYEFVTKLTMVGTDGTDNRSAPPLKQSQTP